MVLTGETEVLGEKHYTAWVVDGWMSMEQWWNGTERGIPKTWMKTCHSATLPTKTLTWTDARSNPGSRGERPASNRLCPVIFKPQPVRHQTDRPARTNTPKAGTIQRSQHWTVLHQTTCNFNLAADGLRGNKTTAEIRHKNILSLVAGSVSRMAIDVTRRGRDI